MCGARRQPSTSQRCRGAGRRDKQLADDRLRDPVEFALGAQLSVSHNSGIAFGVLSGAPDGVVLAAILLALAALIARLVRGWLPTSAPAV